MPDWITWSGIEGDPSYLILKDGTQKVIPHDPENPPEKYHDSDQAPAGWLVTLKTENRLILMIGVDTGRSGTPSGAVTADLACWEAEDIAHCHVAAHEVDGRIELRTVNSPQRMVDEIFNPSDTYYPASAEELLELMARLSSLPVVA